MINTNDIIKLENKHSIIISRFQATMQVNQCQMLITSNSFEEVADEFE